MHYCQQWEGLVKRESLESAPKFELRGCQLWHSLVDGGVVFVSVCKPAAFESRLLQSVIAAHLCFLNSRTLQILASRNKTLLTLFLCRRVALLPPPTFSDISLRFCCVSVNCSSFSTSYILPLTLLRYSCCIFFMISAQFVYSKINLLFFKW